MNKESIIGFYTFNGNRLRRRTINCIILFGIFSLLTLDNSNLLNLSKEYSHGFWVSTFLLSIIVGFELIRYHKNKIRKQEIHYFVNTDRIINIKSILYALVLGALIGVSNDFFSKLLPTSGHPIYFIVSFVACIGYFIFLLWLLRYEKQHGPVYEVNDYYAEKDETSSSS